MAEMFGSLWSVQYGVQSCSHFVYFVKRDARGMQSDALISLGRDIRKKGKEDQQVGSVTEDQDPETELCEPEQEQSQVRSACVYEVCVIDGGWIS